MLLAELLINSAIHRKDITYENKQAKTICRHFRRNALRHEKCFCNKKSIPDKAKAISARESHRFKQKENKTAYSFTKYAVFSWNAKKYRINCCGGA